MELCGADIKTRVLFVLSLGKSRGIDAGDLKKAVNSFGIGQEIYIILKPVRKR